MNLVLLDTGYTTRLVGVHERVVADARIAAGPVRDALRALVDQVLKGKVKPRSIRHAGTVDFDRLEITEYDKTRDADKNRTITKAKQVKLQLHHVTTVQRFTRTRDLEEHDAEGEPLEPFVSISFQDGTSIEVPYVEPKAKGEKTEKD